jgi:hypothetical protein
MNPVEKNARAVLAKLHGWRHEKFAVEGNLLLSATGLTATEINDAVSYLKKREAVSTIDVLGTYPYIFGELSITSEGEFLFQEWAGGESTPVVTGHGAPDADCDYDCFICHASDDKVQFVDALAHGLRKAGCKVWYDDFILKVGDSLDRKINDGLLKSRHGVVVLSQAFFRKDWPQKELDGLAALAKKRGILPVWLDVNKEDIVQFSPMLAGIYAAKASDGLDAVVESLLDAMGKPPRVSSESVERSDANSTSTLPKLESELLTAVAREGKLYHCRTAQIPAGWVRAGKTDFIDKSDPAAAVQHVDALESLVSKGYARHEGGMLYVLTSRGLSAARALASQGGTRGVVASGEKTVEMLVGRIIAGGHLAVACRWPSEENPITGTPLAPSRFLERLADKAKGAGIVVLDYDGQIVTYPHVYVLSYNFVRIASRMKEFSGYRQRFDQLMEADEKGDYEVSPWGDFDERGAKIFSEAVRSLNRPVLAIARIFLDVDEDGQGEPNYLHGIEIPVLSSSMSLVFDLHRDGDWRKVSRLVDYFVDDVNGDMKLMRGSRPRPSR